MDCTKEMKELETAVSEKLCDKKSSVRRSAAKSIGKNRLVTLSEQLLTAYIAEKNDPRTWETQCEMIRALGRIKCSAALPLMVKIVDQNNEFETITSCAATAYVRLMSEIKAPEKIAIELFAKQGYSVLKGALDALYHDKVIPSESDIKSIIGLINGKSQCGNDKVISLKERLVCLMSYWPMEIVRPYLEEYLEDESVRNIVVESALKGKSYGPKEY